MAQLSKKIELYAAANNVASVEFEKDVKLRNAESGVYIYEWSIKGLAEPTTEQLNSYETDANAAEAAQAVLTNRKKEYPSIADQLDDIYHNGIDGWKTTIKTTKDKYPK
jgi:hypothetical protein